MLDLAFDLKAVQAKQDLDAAVRPYMPQAVPPDPRLQQMQQMPMAGIQGGAPGQANIMGMMPLGGGASLMGNANIASGPQGGPFVQGAGAQMQMPMAGGALNAMASMGRPAPGMPMRPQNFGVDFQKGDTGVGLNYTPGNNGLMLNARHRFAKGGLASRVR